MKLSPAETAIVERMAPGVLCREGFLCGDPRPLPEILDTDGAAVERLHLTHELVAERLGALLDVAMEGMGATVEVCGGLSVRYRESMGRIACPWGGCGVFAKGEVELMGPDGPVLARFTPLSVHLIGVHGFYQGRGSRYRIEPASLPGMVGRSGEGD
ncbi:MAG: hypothetical protein ACYS5V_09570 [Planctomycetota bacterium]|jgi:hypothetical protein